MSETMSGAALISTPEVLEPLEEQQRGSGPPLIMLHGGDGLLFSGPFLDALGQTFSVRATSHPGWGGSARGDYLSTVDDLSYVYLDHLERTSPVALPLVGCSLGGWLAADIAIKNVSRVSALVLVSPLGIKISDRMTRDFLDIYAVSRPQVDQALYGTGPRPDLMELEMPDFEYLARAQESVARFCWKPYLHDPKLWSRLHRISVPTLVVWGDEDRLVLNPDAYYDAYSRAIGPNATVHRMSGVGHRLEEQAPQELATVIIEFLAKTAGAA